MKVKKKLANTDGGVKNLQSSFVKLSTHLVPLSTVVLSIRTLKKTTIQIFSLHQNRSSNLSTDLVQLKEAVMC
jgi:hypothetical protein